jgi:preprotein translocase subunit SecG
MSALFLTIHVIVCVVLIIAILLQSGKSADLAGAFGGMGSQSVFGPRGAATLLAKVATICAILFMITSLGLWILSAKGESSVISGEEAPAEQKPAVTETQKKEGEEKKAPEGTTEQKPEAKKPGEEVKKQGQETEKKKSETEKKKPETEKK